MRDFCFVYIFTTFHVIFPFLSEIFRAFTYTASVWTKTSSTCAYPAPFSLKFSPHSLFICPIWYPALWQLSLPFKFFYFLVYECRRPRKSILSYVCIFVETSRIRQDYPHSIRHIFLFQFVNVILLLIFYCVRSLRTLDRF